MTREEHLQWCKDRALEYLVEGNGRDAVASMLSDLSKHEAWQDNKMMPTLSFMGMTYATVNDLTAIRRWIKGFN